MMLLRDLLKAQEGYEMICISFNDEPGNVVCGFTIDDYNYKDSDEKLEFLFGKILDCQVVKFTNIHDITFNTNNDEDFNSHILLVIIKNKAD